MTFDHTVKYNGKIYPTGTEVPVGVESDKNIVDSNGAQESNQNVDATDSNGSDGSTGEKNHEYNKTDILKMNVDDLKKLAAELSIDVTDESTGKVLKEQIIEKLGL